MLERLKHYLGLTVGFAIILIVAGFVVFFGGKLALGVVFYILSQPAEIVGLCIFCFLLGAAMNKYSHNTSEVK